MKTTRQIVIAAMLLMPLLGFGADVVIETTEWHGDGRWHGVDKQGKPTGGYYETVDLLLVHTNGIYSTFTCRLEGGQRWRDWSGKGRRFRVHLDGAVLKKIQTEPGCEISSTNLTMRQEINNDRPNESAQLTAPKVAEPGR